MKKIYFGTKNKAKIDQISWALAPIDVQVEGTDQFDNLPEVEEDGETAEENARKKALAYAEAIKLPVYAMDNSLYFENVEEKDQPGINVRRFPGSTERPTDEEMILYYSSLIKKYGGKIEGYFRYGVAIAWPDGTLEETVVTSPKRIFVEKPCAKRVEGYPMESLQIDPETGKYIAEMPEEEQSSYWQRTIGAQVLNFFEKVIEGGKL